MNNGLVTLFSGRMGHYLLLLAVGGAMFFVNLGGCTLWDVDEGRNSTASFEMMESGNWIVPTFNAELRIQKPALFYWLQIASYRLFGVNEFGARFPSAVAALLTLLVCYELGRRLFDAATGLLGALVLASTPLVCATARFANQDALLNLCTVLAMMLFWWGWTGGRCWWLWASVATGLAVLAKGPIAVIMIGGGIGLFLLWNRRLSWLWQRGLAWGVLFFCLIALPWYIWVAVETRANFLHGFFMIHNVGRFLSPMEQHGGGPHYYLVVLFVGCGLWSIFLPAALWYGSWSAVRRPWQRVAHWWQAASDCSPLAHCSPHAPRTDAYRFLIAWFVVVLLFLSAAATKLPNYLLPISVPAALLLGRFLERSRRGELVLPAWSGYVAMLCLGLIGVGTAAGLFIAGGRLEFPFLRGRSIPELEVWALLGLIPLAGALVGWRCLRGRRHQAFIATCAATAVAFVLPLAAWVFTAFNAHKAPRPLVEQAGAFDRARDLRIGGWKAGHLPSLHFYCQRNITHHWNEQQALDFLRYPMQVYLVTPANCWEELAKRATGPHRVLTRHRDMLSGRDIVVVTNHW